MITLTDTNEAHILKELKEGSEFAFNSLYKKYYAELYVHAYQKIRDREQAKDIVHDLFTVIWQKRDLLHIEGSLSAYLYSGIRNRVLDLLAKDKTKEKYLTTLEANPFLDSNTTDSLVREKMLQEQIARTLSQMPPRIREIFELSRQHYLTHKEIAEKLNISEHTVRSYVKEALKVLRSKLGSLIWVLFIVYLKFF